MAFVYAKDLPVGTTIHFAFWLKMVVAFAGGCTALALSDLCLVGFQTTKYVKGVTAAAALGPNSQGGITPGTFRAILAVGTCLSALLLFWLTPEFSRIASDAIYHRPATQNTVKVWRYEEIVGFERYRFSGGRKGPNCPAYAFYFHNGESITLIALGVDCELQEAGFQWIQARRSNPELKRTPRFAPPSTP